MKSLMLAAAFGLVATTAFAQDYGEEHYYRDRGYRHHDEGDIGGQILRHGFRALEGRSAYEGCTIREVRRVRPDGDVVITRRRICD